MPTLPSPAVPANVSVILFDSARVYRYRSFGLGLSSAGLPASENYDGSWAHLSVEMHRKAGREAAFRSRDPICPAGATPAEERAWDQGATGARRAIDRAYEMGRSACLADAAPTPPSFHGPESEVDALRGAWLDGFGDTDKITVRNLKERYEAWKLQVAVETCLRTYEGIPSDDALLMV